MDSYGQPELLNTKEYETFQSYAHLTEKATTYLRENLSKLDDSWKDHCLGVFYKNKMLVFEIPNKEMTHCMQLILKDDDFRIFHTKEDSEFDLDLAFMSMRIGGITKPNILKAFLKKEVRLIISDDNDIDFG